MTLILLSILTLILITAAIVGYRKQGVHSVLAIVAALNWVRVVPYAFMVSMDHQYLDSRVIAFIGAGLIDDTLAKYLLLECIGSIVLLLSIYKSRFKWRGVGSELRLTRGAAYLFFISGAALVVFQLMHFGGLIYVLQNLDQRSSVTKGLGFLGIPTYIFLASAIVISAMRAGVQMRRLEKLEFLVFLLLGMLMLGAFGGRKSGLLLLITGLVSWAVYVRQIRIRPLAVAGLTAVFLLYMNGISMLRQADGFQKAIADPSAILVDSFSSVLDVFSQLSYLPTYMISIAKFDRSDYWWGAIFVSAPATLIPSSIFPDKPPMDEGVYFKSFMEGYDVYPPMSANKLYPSSMPPETFGNGYAFMGPVGVILFYILKGILLIIGLRYLRRIVAPFSVVCGVYFIYGFEISVFRSVQCLQIFVLCGVLAFIFRRIIHRGVGSLRPSDV